MKTLKTKRCFTEKTAKALKKEYKHADGFKLKKIRNFGAYEVTFLYEDKLDVVMFCEMFTDRARELADELVKGGE